jgi:hypothetical protein
VGARLLRDRGSSPQIRSAEGETAAALAARSGRSEVVEILDSSEEQEGGLLGRF